MNNYKGAYKGLPGVDRLLASAELQPLLSRYGKELLTFAIRQTLDACRKQIQEQNTSPSRIEIIESITENLRRYGKRNLRKVINSSGVIIHTNLGRAPFSHQLLHDTFEVLQGYNNLEFNLKTGTRGSRNDHASAILRFLTGAEDILIVNNAAAAVMMVLRTFARNREVIVSRGELIEIGGSFRIPEIMEASGCKMVEVGTTNKTRLSDYEQKINEQTALLFKAHKSNYVIKGFTEEVSVNELANLGKKHHLPVLYDLGSGLLRKMNHPALDTEPDVRQALATGVDMVCFSGDKLLGGPQAGIIAGTQQHINTLRKEPMLRALRVCKTILALLETACLYYMNENELNSKNLIFKVFHRKKADIYAAAKNLQSVLNLNGIATQIVPSMGQCGGGSLPDAGIDSYAVQIVFGKSNKESSHYAEKMYHQLLAHEQPVLGILRQGNILFDLLTIESHEIETLAKVINESHKLIT